MQLDPAKVKQLEAKIGRKEVEVPEVPAWMYGRAQIKEVQGEQQPVFTKFYTKTVSVPASLIDRTVDQICNNSEEAWLFKDIYPVAKRPGKTTGAEHFIILFIRAIEIVLPWPEDKEEEKTEDAVVDDETLKRAEEWETQGS